MAGPITKNKHSTRLVLQRAGIPVPKGRSFRFSDLLWAEEYAESLGYPVVVKPLNGMEGKGVVTDVMSKAQLEWAFSHVEESAYGGGDILVEEQIRGEAYRFLVIRDRVVSVLYKRRGRIVGDGSKSVGALIEEKQAFRRANPHLLSRPLKVTEATNQLLSQQGYGLESVPAEGEEVLITYSSNTHQGGEHAQVISQVHSSYLEASVEAVKAIPGLKFAGVDFLIEDPTQPIETQGAAICEVNSVPGADTHEYPLIGEPRPVISELLLHSASESGVRLRNSPATDVDVDVEIVGRFKDQTYVEWLNEKAKSLGVTGEVARITSTRASGAWFGSPHMVSILVSFAHLGLRGSPVKSVGVAHRGGTSTSVTTTEAAEL
ncbi:ATP-grasp domain-containing protein [Nesterenkonia sp. MY13]|uniref:ATP-grasp domain-containing protein n=1 Tax=Nesterenkonia sedimenti TaxID=1463632 RepID=A0A7X8TJS0_9MICC|nr:ATP-grasp domain-containing protein [Nesterenkonia sedimenti]